MEDTVDAGTPPRSRSRSTRPTTGTGSCPIDAPIATLTMRVTPDGGLRDDYELKLNSYDLGVDIELHDAVQRLRFEHPEVQAVVVTGGLDKVFCAGANIQMLAGVDPRPQGQLLQVHQRDAQRHRGRHGPLRADVDRRRQRHRGRRWLRAGAGVRRDPPRRRPVLGRVAARGAAARRAARHRRADPVGRQAPRPPRPRRRVRHPGRGRQGPAGPRLGPRRRHRPAQPASTRSCASGRWRGPRASARPDRRRGDRADAARTSRSTTTRCATRTSTSTIDRQLGAAHITVRAPDERQPRRRRTSCSRPAPTRGSSPPPASSTTPCSTCASTSPRSAPGCCTPTATRLRSPPPRTCSAPTPSTGSSTRSRLLWTRDAQAARPVGAHARRARRAGQLLRRHARRAGARRRPLVHARRAGPRGRRRRRRRCASPTPTTAGSRWPTG